MNTAFVVEREIEDVEFSEQQIEEFREQIWTECIERGDTDPSDAYIERKLREKVEEVAKDMTLNDQGHNDLHRHIDHGEAESVE